MKDFIITSTISLGVLLAVYHLLLEREKMHRFNRFYLLAALAFSFVIPFITLPAALAVMPAVTEKATVSGLLSTGVTPATITAAAAPQDVNYWTYTGWGLYGLIVLGLAIRFSVNIRRFYNVKKQSRTLAYEGVALVILKDNVLPHTFLDNIFISEKDYEERFAAPELLTHELTHIHQRHTLDILFIELVKIVLWFNPLVYLYKRAIQMNHEFLADENVVGEHNNVPAYQQLLLEKAIPSPVYALASTINFNITKKRFIMMTKTTTKIRAAILQLAILPVIAALMLLSCSTSDIVESKTAAAIVTENITPTGSVEVTTVTEDEKKALLVSDPKTFDDPTAEYKRIKITDKEKNGSTTEKITYRKDEPMNYDWDHNSEAAKIDPNELVSIDVFSMSDAQIDSLKTTNPGKYGKYEPKSCSVVVYKLKDGKTIKEVVHRKSVASN
ncbi:hypothetical protein HYN59_02305 [Flavobacterium album]|uniref:Peptidase M56 domain-containing protein n=1 Tax=Flavobacterium album TaxID=2175091 RepID=A0A2S1QUF8_9FLAO|nr:M56 family metallopeptidase [Flavobacterium album]AWH84013.1 hypothetical protein HYN59_02305 [Flavobacterium album]